MHSVRKEYKEKHKEEMQAYKKKHYEEYKEDILQKCKDRYNEKKEEILENNKVYRENSKNNIKAWECTKVMCFCGFGYTLTNKARHLKSLRHQNHEATRNQPMMKITFSKKVSHRMKYMLV